MPPKAKRVNKKKSITRRNGGDGTMTHRGRPAGTLWMGLSGPPYMRGVDTDTVFTVVQSGPNTAIAQTANSVNSGALINAFNNVDQYGSWAAVFDQYRIDEVEYTFRPAAVANPLAPVSAILVPCLYTAIDFDDATSPSGLAYMREYNSLSVSENETVVRRYKPHVAIAAYSGAFTSYANQSAQWIDCSSATVVHYGCKWAIDAGAVGQTALQYWNVSYRLRISFRNVH